MKHHPELARLLTEASDTTNFIAYDATQTQTKGKADINNCAVRAISVAFDLPMDEVKRHFASTGARKYGQGTPTKDCTKYIEGKGAKVKFVKAFGDIALRLSSVLEYYPKGRYILSMRKHLVALVDGKVIDLAGLDINQTNRVWLRDKAEWYTYKRLHSPVFKVWQVS